MDDEQLQQLVLSLLEPDIFKTTAQVAEELRTEHSKEWKKLVEEGEVLYGKSCSSVQQPAGRIAGALLSLSTDQCLCRRINRENCWSRVGR